jgi:tRNA A-37 threonylcarbamoyl transferase component Bud32
MAKVIDNYEIISEVPGGEEGAMGIVYLARDRLLHRDVALKVLRFSFLSDEVIKERFMREAELAAALVHPNIVTVYKKGTSPPYFAMQYLPGGSLRAKLRENKAMIPPRCFSSGETMETAIQVASALADAHRHIPCIIHRDIKPANILFDAEGMVKVTDFGIAKVASDFQLTFHGQMLGTPAFMSPEQEEAAEDVGPPSDIYSLGIVMYEMVTGKNPFADRTGFEKQPRLKPGPPSLIVPSIDPNLDAIIMKCLEDDPGERFADGRELVVALSQARALHGDTSHRPVIKKPTEKSVVSAETHRPFWTVFSALGCVLFLSILIGIGITLKKSNSKPFGSTLIPQKGLLTLTVFPANAAVYLDGTYAGTAPFSDHMPIGSHSIVLKAPAFSDTVFEIVLSKEGLSLECNLRKKNGLIAPPPVTNSITITSIPTRARVSFNHRMLGFTPFYWKNPPIADLTVAISHDGFSDAHKVINYNGGNSTLSVSLIPRSPDSSRSYESVVSVIENNYDEIVELYARMIEGNSSPPPSITVKLGINGLGQAVFCTISKPQLEDPEFDDAFTKKVMEWDFGRRGKASEMAKFTYTFNF